MDVDCILSAEQLRDILQILGALAKNSEFARNVCSCL